MKYGLLAPALLEACAQIAIPHDRVASESIDLSQVVPTEYRADAVVSLRGEDDAPVAAIVVEVQLSVDRDKEYTWPAYVATLRDRMRCPVVLLVLAPDAAVAAWARRKVALGHPGFGLAPIVVSFSDVPRINDSADARKLPELGVLSVLAHPELDVAETVLPELLQLPAELARLYWELIIAAVPQSPGQRVLTDMQSHIKSIKRYREDLLAEGLQQGLQQGQRIVALKLLHKKLPTVTAEDQATIEAMRDEQALNHLVDALIDANSPDEARAALAALQARR